MWGFGSGTRGAVGGPVLLDMRRISDMGIGISKLVLSRGQRVVIVSENVCLNLRVLRVTDEPVGGALELGHVHTANFRCERGRRGE